MCDFHVPAANCYIEHLGLSDPDYLARSARKRELYGKYGLRLIELTEEDIRRLDDVLPRKLLAFGLRLT
jgi:hypothetical protein